ncbi:MAG: PQQ-binding-like beta-propeller repeat protein [Verrucomicrobiota bacterium]
MQRFPSRAIPALAALAAAGLLTAFWLWRPEGSLSPRLPGTDRPPGEETAAENPVLAGKTISGEGKPAPLPGAWPGFRGANRDAISPESTPLARSWPAGGPRPLWSVEVGEGYAGAAVRGGRVYVMDYARDRHESVLRCLSLEDGQEIWRFGYPLPIKRNHGVTRTVPAVTEQAVVALDPKCNVLCVDAATGALRWGLSLVRAFGATVPPWYAGQCPLVEGNTVILAPGGPDALLVAADLTTGKILWKTPNPHGWKMTHSSIVPMEFAGRRMLVYCASGGVVGVSAQDGAILWESADWKISIATIATPIPAGEGRIFFSGGYNAGCLMAQLAQAPEGGITVRTLFRVAAPVFGATQQTPILHGGRIFGVRPNDGRLACLDLEGKPVWTGEAKFGLGPLLMADGLLYVMNDEGRLALYEASPQKATPLAEALLFPNGHEAWGPMALAGGRLLVRDFTRMICVDVKAR